MKNDLIWELWISPSKKWNC